MTTIPSILPGDFFDLAGYEHPDLFKADEPVWTALDRLPDYMASFFKETWPLAGHAGLVNTPLVIVAGEVRTDVSIKALKPGGIMQAFENGNQLVDAAIIMPGVYLFDDQVIIGPGTVVESGVMIKGPTVIGSHTEIRQGAYLRGDCLIGNRCVVGHTTEVKGAIMLDDANAAHFAYVGDSILGKNVNLGAGTKLANLKIIPGSVSVAVERKFYNTHRRKLGAILGDNTETGCNSVTSPGTLMRQNSVVFPAVSVPGGYYPPKSFVMLAKGSIEIGSKG